MKTRLAGALISPPPSANDTTKRPCARLYRLDSTKYVKALIGAARQLPGADGSSVGLIGVSRGATEALLVASSKEVQAVVSDSATYNPPTTFDTAPLSEVKNLSAPVLMLHGTADRTVPVQVARDYERVLAQWGRVFEAHYYGGQSRPDD